MKNPLRRRSEPRTVVVTGASAGVGRATAKAFGARGDRVALIARGHAGLAAAAAEVKAAGGTPLAVPADVASPAELEHAAERIEDAFGPIDVWVNNAMTSVFSRVADLTAEELRRATEVTYLGGAYGTMTALRRMLPRDRGTIVQVGSALAYRAIPLQAAYCASKFALRAFTDSLRCELMHDKSSVRITMVHLPGLNTPQFTWVRVRLPEQPRPVAPVYQPEVPARAIVWASEHPRREIWVGRSTVKTIIGNRLVPGLADRYLARTNFDAQQTGKPLPPDWQDDLFEPVGEDRGAHGPFDDEATPRSLQTWLTMHRRVLVGGAVAGAAAGVAAAGARDQRWPGLPSRR